MTTTISIEEAQASLPEIIGRLSADQEVVITRDHQPVARLVPVGRRKLGTMQGTVNYMAPDFDAPLEDFEEHSS
jgi:antitoxin (DNA-binding transcriptional repressor) of toxin-antitoxin stability system